MSALATPKTTMNDSTAALRRQVELVLGDRGQDRPLHAHHRADERVDEDEQRELRQVLAQAEPRRRGAHGLASGRPRFARRIRSIPAGWGGTSTSAATNSSFGRVSIGFQRFSKPIVLDGLPLSPAPQAEPAKCAGKISRPSGSVSSLAWMLS